MKDGNLKAERGIRASVFGAVGLLAGLIVLAAGVAGAQQGTSADLSISKSDSPDPVGTGKTLTYTIQVTNSGPDTATDVVVTDKLRDGVGFVSATATQGSCDRKGNNVTCDLGDLVVDPYYAESSATVTLKVTAPDKAGTISNTAEVSSKTDDPKENNNSDTERTDVKASTNEPTGKPKCGGATATIVGTPGPDNLTGTSKRDVIKARGGADEVSSAGGKDIVCADRGRDTVRGGAKADLLRGGNGRDRLAGRSGDDVVRGGRRADRLSGGSGDDLLAGGRGRDRCRGGKGNDTLRSCER